MHCEYCGTLDPETIVILGVRSRFVSGALNTVVCLPCAQKSPHYCTKHQVPMDGYSDDTTACRLCAAEQANNPEQAGKIWQAIVGSYRSLHMVDFATLPDHIVISVDARMGMLKENFQDAFRATLVSSVVNKALRLRKPVAQIIRESSGLSELLS